MRITSVLSYRRRSADGCDHAGAADPNVPARRMPSSETLATTNGEVGHG